MGGKDRMTSIRPLRDDLMVQEQISWTCILHGKFRKKIYPQIVELRKGYKIPCNFDPVRCF